MVGLSSIIIILFWRYTDPIPALKSIKERASPLSAARLFFNGGIGANFIFVVTLKNIGPLLLFIYYWRVIQKDTKLDCFVLERVPFLMYVFPF